MAGEPYYTPEELERVVADSRAAQGLPVHLEDPVVAARLAGLIKATPPRDAAQERVA
jgi:hypothetical protein